jgi:hypothetical protein
MRTGALLLAILLGSASVLPAITAADAAPKKAAKKSAEPEDLNANGKKLVMDGLPLIMPQAVMLWMLHNKEVEAKEAAAKAKPAKKMAKAKTQ